MLHSSEVPVGESALLVVDAQDSFKATPRWERDNVLTNFDPGSKSYIQLSSSLPPGTLAVS